jgi:hypothetical protein
MSTSRNDLGTKLSLAVWLVAAGGCVGEIPGLPSEDGQRGAAPATGSRGTNGPSGTDERGPVASTAEPCAPGTALLRRLTNEEFARTIEDLLGERPDVARFPSDEKVEGFDNNAEGIRISASHLESFLTTAEGLVASAFSSPARRQAILECEPSGSGRMACLRSFAERFGRRAYRRPLSADEVDSLLRVAQGAASEADPYVAPALIAATILASPKFLYRVETGLSTADPTLRKLDEYEVASRLSFLILRSGPTADLLDQAAAGRLKTAAGVEAAARGLLSNAAAKDAAQAFYEQWLSLELIGTVDLDTKVYPEWSDSLRKSMAEEARRFLGEITWSSGSGGLLDLLTSPIGFVDANLAKVYGVSAPSGSGLTRVDLRSGPAPRSGLLTQAGLLAMTSHEGDERMAPISRGVYIRSVLMCEALPAPPDDVPPLAPSQEGLTVAEQLEAHRKDPACGGCHRLIDPIGFGLSRYTATGTYRERDKAGRTISEAGAVVGMTPEEFSGPVELGARLRQSGRFAGCIAQKLTTYALGRTLNPQDACLTARVKEEIERNPEGGWAGAISALVGSEAFLTIRATNP